MLRICEKCYVHGTLAEKALYSDAIDRILRVSCSDNVKLRGSFHSSCLDLVRSRAARKSRQDVGVELLRDVRSCLAAPTIGAIADERDESLFD